MTSHAYAKKQHDANEAANIATKANADFRKAFEKTHPAGAKGNRDRQARKFRQRRGKTYAATQAG